MTGAGVGDRERRDGGLEAGDAARAEAEAAAEAVLGDEPAPVALIEATSVAGPRPDAVCPYLRLEHPGELGPPSTGVDPDHRCVALATPVTLSESQQALVCLIAAHVDCPRFIRGSHGASIPPTDAVPRFPRPTLAAIVVLAASLCATLAFTAARGGLVIPIVAGSPSAGTADVTSPSPSPGASAAASVLQSPSAPPPSTSASSAPSSTPSSLASPSAPTSPGPSAVPSPTSDRYALLRSCPGRAGCYIYTVRAGDNFTSIGLYFGIPFDTLLRLNPWIRDPTTIHVGDRIVMPPPTR